MSELEKLESVSEKSQAIGEFLEWLFSAKSYHISRYLTDEEYESEDNVYWVDGLYEKEQFKRHEIGKEELIPIYINVEKLLAEFFEIDLKKVEEERRKLLNEIREKNTQKEKDNEDDRSLQGFVFMDWVI